MTLPISGREITRAALLLCLVLAACAAPASSPTPNTAPTYPPVPTLTRVVETPLPPTPAPSMTPTTASARERVFSSLAQALPQLDFSPLVPAYIPDDLPLARVSLSEQKALQLYYAFSGQSPETSPRLLSLTQATGGEPVTVATISNPERGALDALAVKVRGQEGFLYWTYAEGGRPSYRLAWREQNVNLTLALTGSWAAGSGADPHSLDPLLLAIASGLIPDTSRWQVVSAASEAGAVTFSIPADWKAEGASAFAGADGFARLKTYSGPAVSLTQACEWEANASQEGYGAQPELSLIQAGGAEDSICLVRPDSGQAAILIPSPPAGRPVWRLLSVSARHAMAVARSIRLAALPGATGEPRVEKTPPPPAPSQVLNWQGLSVEIYPLGAQSMAAPDVFLTAPAAVLEKHRATREQPAPPSGPAVLHGQQLTLGNASIPHPFAENGQVQVSADGQIIYRYNLVSPADARSARLFARDDQWVLNVNGILVTNSEIANTSLGYDRIEGWTLLAGQPFYFAEKDGQVRVSYAGVLFPQVFDRLLDNYPHGSNERMVWFTALKDGQVLYIEMGRY